MKLNKSLLTAFATITLVAGTATAQAALQIITEPSYFTNIKQVEVNQGNSIEGTIYLRHQNSSVGSGTVAYQVIENGQVVDSGIADMSTPIINDAKTGGNKFRIHLNNEVSENAKIKLRFQGN